MKEDDSDETLMVAYVAGDRRAFEVLFARLAPKLHGFFQRTLRDTDMADELLQMTFLKLHQSRAQYRPELALRPWVFTIAASVRNDALRRRYRTAEVMDDEKLARADESQAIAVARESAGASADVAEQVRAAVERLPEAQRMVVHLHRFEGMTFGEIAKVLGANESAVRVRAFRAYELLRRELKGLLGEVTGR